MDNMHTGASACMCTCCRSGAERQDSAVQDDASTHARTVEHGVHLEGGLSSDSDFQDDESNVASSRSELFQALRSLLERDSRLPRDIRISHDRSVGDDFGQTPLSNGGHFDLDSSSGSQTSSNLGNIQTRTPTDDNTPHTEFSCTCPGCPVSIPGSTNGSIPVTPSLQLSQMPERASMLHMGHDAVVLAAARAIRWYEWQIAYLRQSVRSHQDHQGPPPAAYTEDPTNENE